MKLLKPVPPEKLMSAIIFVRFTVGAVFLSEGIQKFLFPATRGAGRFMKIGLPAPDFLSYFVATFEVVCGALILVGVLTRFAAIPLIIIMLVAIGSTKIPILLDQGFWEMAHAARTDYAMLLSSLFLLLCGGGKWSLHSLFSKKSVTLD